MTLNNENYAHEASKVMYSLKGIQLSNSKLRKIWGYIVPIYEEAKQIKGNQLSSEIISDLEYLRIKVAYEVGRDTGKKPLKTFINKINFFHLLDSVNRDKKNFLLFCRYMESLVSYHYYYSNM